MILQEIHGVRRGAILTHFPAITFFALLFLLSPQASRAAFGSPVAYNVGNNPRSVIAADLDADNDEDLAVANYNSNSVSILLNNGNGTFAPALNYAVGSRPANVFAADLDGDGDLDLAVGNFVSDNISILLNNGDGTFAAAVNYVSGDGAWSVFAADLDGDTDLDLAVTNSNASTISVFKNNGDGTLAAAVTYAVQNVPASIYAIDLDGDGDRDLAVANYFGATVSILLNNGDGTFAAAVHYEVGNWGASQWNYPIALVAIDLDGDNDADIATANYDNNQVSVLTNNGDGTFTASVEYPVGSRPPSISAADLDNDGDPDLATANYFGGTASVLLNNGNGTFAAKTDYSAPGAWSVAAADLDNDGDQDLAVTNYDGAKVSILLSDVAAPSLSIPGPPRPPLINLRKTASLLALPDGPGEVTFTYRVINPGVVTMTDISLEDDHCDDIEFISGDTNNNTWLETSEEWTYQCTTTFSETAINFATVRGYGRGMVSIDTSVIEIFVGEPKVVPLIHLIKVPDPLLLPAGGGQVVFTYTVTNPGIEPLNDIAVISDVCADVKYAGGDLNENSLLEPEEEWVYTCATALFGTTISTAIATGEADGKSAIDPAIAMVLVIDSPEPTTVGPYSVAEALKNSPSINFDKGFALPVGGAPVPCISGSLVKLPSDGDPATPVDSAVYYCGEDGKRHIFPNEGTYYSWYPDFSDIVTISAKEMAAISIGRNVTYRPGSRLIKVCTDPKVYAVAKGGILRWVTDEVTARMLYGPNWNSFVDDICETIFDNYTVGPAITPVDAVLGSLSVIDFPGRPIIDEPVLEPAPACTSDTTFARFLSLGSTDPEVRALQRLLQCLGDFPSDVAPTGYFGPITKEAVKKFQSAHGIESVGYVGPATREALNRY